MGKPDRPGFTFHYGSTYTLISVIQSMLLISFTFHYGSTYTVSTIKSRIGLDLIYIPLWFYLYGQKMAERVRVFLFTFHYGSTYTHGILHKAEIGLNLHSTMVLLIPHGTINTSANRLNLHSTMVLLILCVKYALFAVRHYLHSTMVLLIQRWRQRNKIFIFIYIPLWFYLYAGRRSDQ